MTRRLTIFGVLLAFVIGLFVAVVPASASVKGRRNTAGLLTGAAAYELLRGKTGTGLVLGAGAAYAWKRTKDAKRAEARRRYAYRHHSRRYASHTRHYAYNR